MSDFTPETRPGERWWEMISQKPHCVGGTPYKMPSWYHDYTTQIELEQFNRGLVQHIGYPYVIRNGQRYTVSEMAKAIGCKTDTFTLHLLRGATRYKELRWEVDFEEYTERTNDYKAKLREDRRKKREADEAAKALKSKDKGVSRNWSENRSKNNLEAYQKMIAGYIEEAKKGLEFIPRADVPGAVSKLYFNGRETKAMDIIEALGYKHQSVLANLLRLGDFRTPDGDLVEIRQRTKEEIYSTVAGKLRQVQTGKLPYDVIPREIKKTGKGNPAFTFNGEVMLLNTIAEKLKLNPNTISRLSLSGRIVAKDGSYVIDRAYVAPPMNAPIVRLYDTWGVVRWSYWGREYSLFKSTDLRKVEEVFREIMAGGYINHPRVKKIIDKVNHLG